MTAAIPGKQVEKKKLLMKWVQKEKNAKGAKEFC